MIKNIFVMIFLILFGGIMYRCTTSTADALDYRRRPGGGYYFIYAGQRVWVNKSFREGSLSGQYRGGGPGAGK
jgi:hypothetical protein